MAQTSGVMKNPQALISKTPDVLHSLEKDLLTEVLQKYEDDPWLKVTSIELTKACKDGDNYMSTIQRAYVEGVTSNGKYFHKYFILKRQMEDMEKRKLFVADQVWANEEHMYITVLPRLRRHCTTELPHPRLYYSDSEIMVMEDLKDSGFAMVDRLTGMDLEHTLLVMKNIALFHAASLAMQRLDPEVFDIMKSNFKHPYCGPNSYDMAASFVSHGIKDAKALFTSVSDQEKYRKILKCLETVEKKQESCITFLIEPPKGELAVVIHGDMWVNNVLFSYDRNTKKPLLVKFVDYQGTRIGSIAIDILHFMYTSIQPEVRKKHSDTILKFYHNNLISFLRDFIGNENMDYIRKFPFSRIQSELSKYRMYGLINAILVLPVVTCDAKNLPSQTSLRNGNSQTTMFLERLTDVVEEYVRNGWINED